MTNVVDSTALRREVLGAIKNLHPKTVRDLSEILREKRGLEFSDERLAGVLAELSSENRIDLDTAAPTTLNAFLLDFHLNGDLFFIFLATMILLAVVSVQQAPSIAFLRWIVGIPAALVFPGYVIQAFIFPRPSDLDMWKRWILAVGLSITVIAVYTPIIDATSPGFSLETVLPAITLHILVLSTFALFRRFRATVMHSVT